MIARGAALVSKTRQLVAEKRAVAYTPGHFNEIGLRLLLAEDNPLEVPHSAEAEYELCSTSRPEPR